MSDAWELKSQFEIENPNDIRMRLTMVAQMRDWQKFHEQLDAIVKSSGNPGALVYEFRRQVQGMMIKAIAEFHETGKEQ
jgi:hypothetical protein